MSDEREFPRGMLQEDASKAVELVAVAFVDQLCSYNNFAHPEVMRQCKRLAEAVDALHHSIAPDSPERRETDLNRAHALDYLQVLSATLGGRDIGPDEALLYWFPETKGRPETRTRLEAGLRDMVTALVREGVPTLCTADGRSIVHT